MLTKTKYTETPMKGISDHKKVTKHKLTKTIYTETPMKGISENQKAQKTNSKTHNTRLKTLAFSQVVADTMGH
jgi:hypothetical protein